MALLGFHEIIESTPDLFENDPSEQAWLDDGLALQVRLLKKNSNPHANASSPSLYPESHLLDRARYCTEAFGECGLMELEDLYTREYAFLLLLAQGCCHVQDMKRNTHLFFVTLSVSC